MKKQQSLVIVFALVVGWALGVASQPAARADAGSFSGPLAERLTRAVEQLARCRK